MFLEEDILGKRVPRADYKNQRHRPSPFPKADFSLLSRMLAQHFWNDQILDQPVLASGVAMPMPKTEHKAASGHIDLLIGHFLQKSDAYINNSRPSQFLS
ncbi:hypothetical protein DdX_09146 [Ditylenchus destructor]|uniref:Uncharacterized protein n=1 Tax=Ditylenchus destructor TaxID=166010 RepID=A0AAD4R3A2_9BILA|nr:hypothetical protein DdX_09146 [Ditylenchus destructor]